MKHLFRTSSLLTAGLAIAAAGSADAALNGASAYITIQPNATKDAFIHTVSWVALDSQYAGSVYDDPNTTGDNEGLRDFITNGTQFGNTGGSFFEVHTWDDPVGQDRYLFDAGGFTGIEVRYQPPAGGTNSYAGGYVYMGTDGSDGAVASAVGNSTPKWDDVGAFTTEPNGAYGHGWDSVTGYRTVNPDGTGTQITNGDGYYMDTDSIDGSAPIDDVGMIFVGFDAVAGDAPTTGYMQTIIPIATAATSTDDYFTNPNFFIPTQPTWTSAYVEGVFTNNAAVEVTVTSSTTYVAKTAVSGDFDSDLDVDNNDILTQIGSYTGSAGTGEFFGQYYRDGDTDGDMDVDNNDILTTIGAFTGSAAGSTVDTGTAADLVYDPITGNVTLVTTDSPGGVITGFQIENAAGGDDFLFANYLGAGLGGTSDVTATVIGEANPFGGVSGTIDLGNIFVTGMDLTDLESFLTLANVTGSLGNGVQEFDLVVTAIPEPSSLALLGLSGILFLRRKSRIAHAEELEQCMPL